MNKTQSRVFMVLGLFAVALVVGNGILFGEIGGEGDMGGGAAATNINQVAKITMSFQDSLLKIEEGVSYKIDKWGGATYDILMRLDLIYPATWPDEMRIDLVLHTGQVIASHDMTTLGYDSNFEVRSGSFDTSAVPTGVWGASFRFIGGWDGGTQDIISPLGGTSIGFFIERSGESRPDAPTVNVITAAQTIEPFTYYDISWEWKYAGPVTLYVVDTTNGAPPTRLLRTDADGSTIKQTFTYSYYARYSGEHFISLQVVPADGSDNVMVEDDVRIVVNIGGDQQDFSPTIERVDIAISAKIYETGKVQTFKWDLFADAPDWTLQQTAVDGIFNIKVTVEPADALVDAELIIDEGEETESRHPLTQSGADWTVAINTDVLEAGQHHLTITGVDRANQQTYTLGEFDIGVRQAQVNPIIYIGIVALIGGVMVFFVLRRKK